MPNRKLARHLLDGNRENPRRGSRVAERENASRAATVAQARCYRSPLAHHVNGQRFCHPLSGQRFCHPSLPVAVSVFFSGKN